MQCKFSPLYKEQIKSPFVIYDMTPCILGGAYIRIIFLDMPNRVFSSWIYSEVNEDKEIVESYEFRSIGIEEETTDMTKEDILQAIKEMDGLKLWKGIYFIRSIFLSETLNITSKAIFIISIKNKSLNKG